MAAVTLLPPPLLVVQSDILRPQLAGQVVKLILRTLGPDRDAKRRPHRTALGNGPAAHLPEVPAHVVRCQSDAVAQRVIPDQPASGSDPVSRWLPVPAAPIALCDLVAAWDGRDLMVVQPACCAGARQPQRRMTRGPIPGPLRRIWRGSSRRLVVVAARDGTAVPVAGLMAYCEPVSLTTVTTYAHPAARRDRQVVRAGSGGHRRRRDGAEPASRGADAILRDHAGRGFGDAGSHPVLWCTR